MRSEWGPAGTWLALHCAPPAISGHDQPDNGTFEMYAFGRWLLTDSGFYTYGHDRAAREWHRQTRVHQTLTLDGRDSRTDGRLRIWHSSPALDALVVENPSYPGLLHRRTVWFVDRKFFVFLDEAVGDAPGALQVHWTPAPGPGRLSPDAATFTTQYPDANVLIHTASPQPAAFSQEDGWFAWEYGRRAPRKVLSLRHPDAAPAAFLTVVAPYPGADPPAVQAQLADGFTAGGDEARVRVQAFGRRWQIGRSLEQKRAWCEAANDEGVAVSSRPAAASPAGNSPRATSAASSAAPEASPAGLERLTHLGSPDHEDEFPAIGQDEAGSIWVCWVAFDGKGDAVLGARIDDNTASNHVLLSETPGDHWRPAMCLDGQGRLWATWAQAEQGRWDIRGAYLANGKWSPAMRLTRGDGNSFGQKLAVDAAGTLWMTWQSAVGDNYEVLLAPLTPKGLGSIVNVSQNPASDWEPAVAAAKDGRICVAWDSYRGGSYDILVAEFRDGHLSEPVGIATTPAYEAHASLAFDLQDRLWIAWDNGGVRWGEDNQDGRKLHSERSVEVCCLADGELRTPARPLTDVLTGSLGSFCELPELRVDGTGRLWLFLRHLTDLTPQAGPGAHVQDRGMWNPYVLCYDGKAWSTPRQLPDSNGRNDMRVAACLGRDGRPWVAWADDGRTRARPPEPRNHKVHAARLSSPDPGHVVLATQAPGRRPGVPQRPAQPALGPAPHRLVAGGRKYLLAYGDTHRHTDLSQCGMNRDGSLMTRTGTQSIRPGSISSPSRTTIRTSSSTAPAARQAPCSTMRGGVRRSTVTCSPSGDGSSRSMPTSTAGRWPSGAATRTCCIWSGGSPVSKPTRRRSCSRPLKARMPL
jgi:hypothetical protein